MSEPSITYKELNRVKINLADLRAQIVDLIKEGYTEVPLADLIFIIKAIAEPSED